MSPGRPLGDITVRPAGIDDAKALAGLIGDLLRTHDMKVPGGLVEAIRRDGFGERPRFEALLARLDGETVGMVLFYPAYRPSLAGPGLLVEDLYVRDRARRHGAGRALMEQVAALARARGCAYIEWTVERDNQGARGFYEGIGAEPREGKVCYHLNGAAIERLARPISPLPVGRP